MIGRLEYVLECKLSPDKNILAYVCKRERSRVVEFCPVVKKKRERKKNTGSSMPLALPQQLEHSL